MLVEIQTLFRTMQSVLDDTAELGSVLEIKIVNPTVFDLLANKAVFRNVGPLGGRKSSDH